MTLLPYDLTFIKPLYFVPFKSTSEGPFKSDSKRGFLIKIERDNITSFADVSPVMYLSPESYKDVYDECKNININQIFIDINNYLEKQSEAFFKEKFLDFDFSKYTEMPSLKHALSCLFSEHYRQKFGLKLIGEVSFHGLIVNSLTLDSQTEVVKKAILLEKEGFKKAKVKIGTSQNGSFDLVKENELLSKILSETENIKLRIDANRKFHLDDFKIIFKNLDLDRIEYVEEPVMKPSDLIRFTDSTQVPLAIDENLKLMKDIVLDGVQAIIIKPTLLGDYYSIKKLINTYSKRGVSAVFSSSFESQVGIYQIAQLAYAINPGETHGLDTFKCFVESLMDLNIHNDSMKLEETFSPAGPLYV